MDGALFRVTVSSPDVAVAGNSRLTRVQWRLDNGELYRDAWLVLDRVQDSEPVSRLILSGVSEIEVTNYEWSDEGGVQQSFDAGDGELPYATELSISLDNDQSFRRLFDLANGS